MKKLKKQLQQNKEAMQTLATKVYKLCKKVKPKTSFGGYLNNVKYSAYCIATQKGDYFHHAGEMVDRFGQVTDIKYFNLNGTRNSKKRTKIDYDFIVLTTEIFEIAKKCDRLEYELEQREFINKK